MERTIVLIILFIILGNFSKAQQHPSDWQAPSEDRPILICGVKTFNDPIWVSVGPSAYQKREINVVVEYDDLNNCPHTLRGWDVFQLDPRCYNHIYISDMIRVLVEDMVSPHIKNRIDSVAYYDPPFYKDGIQHKNLIYCRTPYKDFLIVYVTVDYYLEWGKAWQWDAFIDSPYYTSNKNGLFYKNDPKRHGLFLKFAIPLAPSPSTE